MCDIVDYPYTCTHICVQVDYQLYLLLIIHICVLYVQMNMCDILRKAIARKA